MTKYLSYAFLIFALGIITVSCSAEPQDNSSVSNSNSAKENQELTKSAGQSPSEGASQNAETAAANQQKSTDVNKDTSSDLPELKKTEGFETRCGWYSNPTPGNHWITDSEDEWIIAVQGGHQAEGDYPPEFSLDQWIATNGYYGYGCACLSVKVDKKELRVLEIADGKARPLSACQNDPALNAPEL